MKTIGEDRPTHETSDILIMDEATKQRLLQERDQLYNRIQKLAAFMLLDAYAKLHFIDRALLREQHGLMNRYHEILCERISRVA